MDRYISPPPLQRRKYAVPLTEQTSESHSTSTRLARHGSIRVFAWNINGISPFVQPYFQRSIESFFQPSKLAPEKTRNRKRRQSHSSDDDNERLEEPTAKRLKTGGPDKEAPPSLRAFLQRHSWPQLLLLQEVKIKAGDTSVIDAVKRAINDPISDRIWSKDQACTRESSDIGPIRDNLLSDGGPTYVVHFHLPHDRHNVRAFGGKMYGVASIIRKDFAEISVREVRDVDWDLEGRVQVIETLGLLEFSSITNSLPTTKSSPSTETDPVIPSSIPLSDFRKIHSPDRVSTRKKPLAIINIYAPNGTTNPYRSPTTGTIIGTRHTHKLSFHAHLQQECISLERRGYSVILAGDMNIAPSLLDGYPNLRTWPEQHCFNRADFNYRFLGGSTSGLIPTSAVVQTVQSEHESCPHSEQGDGKSRDQPLSFQGLDTFRLIHHSERRYSYHPRNHDWGTSCDRVDLIIVSQDMKTRVVDAGILDSRFERGPSDHCGIWVEIL